MANLPIDNNSRAIQCARLGYGTNYSAGKLPAEIKGLVRFKNIGEDNAIIRYFEDDTTDGVVLSPGETEYFVVNDVVEVVSGSINVMY